MPTAAPTITIKPDTALMKLHTFIMYYHYRAAARLQLVFEHNGDLKSAIERGRIHCEKMNYRFIRVRPFVVDLDERERRRNDEDFMNHE